MPRRPLLSLAFAAACALLGASCLSPTLPLPPPDVSSVQQSAPGTWTVTGTCKPGAVVSVFDENRGKGVLVEDRENTGTFVVELPADLCDFAWVSQTLGNETARRRRSWSSPRRPTTPGRARTANRARFPGQNRAER